MKTYFNPKNNPRVIIIQKLYGKFYNYDDHINGLASFDKNHLIKHGVKKRHIERTKTNAVPSGQKNNWYKDEASTLQVMGYVDFYSFCL